MVATSGAQLLPDDAVQTMLDNILPLTTILTPNIPEARLLLKTAGQYCDDIKGIEHMMTIANQIQKLGPRFVLLKGGHLPLTRKHRVSLDKSEHQVVCNVLVGHGLTVVLENELSHSKNTHGTGCSLACTNQTFRVNAKKLIDNLAAIACALVQGDDMTTAVKRAGQYVEAGIRMSNDLGRGSGPINHFHSTYSLPFAP